MSERISIKTLASLVFLIKYFRMKPRLLTYDNVKSIPQFEPSFFHRLSYDFINASEELGKFGMRYSSICYYLVCHALEIAMKSYLILNGYKEKDLIDISHNLVDIMKILKTKGYYTFTSDEEKMILGINKYYSKKEFEYHRTAGQKLYPNLILLKDFTWKVIRDSNEKIEERIKHC